MLTRRPPRGFKQASVFVLGFFAYLLWQAIDTGAMPPERIEQFRQLVFFWQ